jgi:DNA-3-methyladenine glycosylase I
MEKVRCAWAGSDPDMIRYHDTEWGVPVYNDRLLFEFLILEGAQAGLSWMTILKRRKGYRTAFDQFNVKKVSSYDSERIESLLKDSGIIRNRLKINASVTNAKSYLRIQEEFGSFSRYQWDFVGGKPIQNRHKSVKDFPVTTPESDMFSRDLKKRGFKFVGSTIIYAYMQAVGMVNDHTISCFRHVEARHSS